jgi:serralysin
LDSGAGQDLVIGRGGADTLRGGAGNDTLSGGGDSDTFIFDAGQDVVLDWTLAQADVIAIDRSLLGGQNLTGAEIVAAYASVIGRDVVLDFGNGNLLTLDRLRTLDGLDGYVFSL